MAVLSLPKWKNDPSGKNRIYPLPNLRKQNTRQNSRGYHPKKLPSLLSQMQKWVSNWHWTISYNCYQSARRTAAEPITQGLNPCGYRLLFIQYTTTACPARRGKKKTVAGQVDFVRSIYIPQRRFWEIKAAAFLLFGAGSAAHGGSRHESSNM